MNSYVYSWMLCSIKTKFDAARIEICLKNSAYTSLNNVLKNHCFLKMNGFLFCVYISHFIFQ